MGIKVFFAAFLFTKKKTLPMIKILIADDSALMRKYLADIFKGEGDFEVNMARNGAVALQMAKDIKPDVITLDVNMPEMDGITCLSRIMVECPRPVVMVSSLTSQDAEVTLQALQLGAVDFIAKPDGTVSLHIDKIRHALVTKVRAAARAKPRGSRFLAERVRRAGALAQEGVTTEGPAPHAPVAKGLVRGLVLIGVSTGGPGAIEAILPRLPKHFPWPILVAQHMPQSFTGVFARRIGGLSALGVSEVVKPMLLEAGQVYVARGDADMLVSRRGTGLTVLPAPASEQHTWHPSVERMVSSALEHVPATNLLGVMLTGMGDDGAAAMTRLRAGGGRTIAEAEETAVVWGMPGELVKRGGASVVLPVHRIADQLTRWAA
jgi:two-component system chemotaxis response regulator CheB